MKKPENSITRCRQFLAATLLSSPLVGCFPIEITVILPQNRVPSFASSGLASALEHRNETILVWQSNDELPQSKPLEDIDTIPTRGTTEQQESIQDTPVVETWERDLESPFPVQCETGISMPTQFCPAVQSNLTTSLMPSIKQPLPPRHRKYLNTKKPSIKNNPILQKGQTSSIPRFVTKTTVAPYCPQGFRICTITDDDQQPSFEKSYK